MVDDLTSHVNELATERRGICGLGYNVVRDVRLECLEQRKCEQSNVVVGGVLAEALEW